MKGAAVEQAPAVQAAIPAIRDGRIVFDGLPMPGTAGLSALRSCVLVPGEQVLAAIVDLPLASHRQRLDAVAFAVEGMLAEPLAGVHVVLGPQVAPKRYLAVMVAHSTMSEWRAILASAGLSQARLLPDCLALPSVLDNGWTVFAQGGRAVVRGSDLAGFCAKVSALPALWRLAGCPAIASCGDALAPVFMATRSAIATPLAFDAVASHFTLGQGVHAASSFQNLKDVKRFAWIAALGLTALGAISVADSLVLHRLANDRRATAQTLISKLTPNSDPTEDIETQLARILPEAKAATPGRFLALFSDVAKALQAEPPGLVVEGLAYDAEDGQLGLDVAAPNLAALQRIEAAMVNAGLHASSGVATAESGAAKVRITIEDAGARGEES